MGDSAMIARTLSRGLPLKGPSPASACAEVEVNMKAKSALPDCRERMLTTPPPGCGVSRTFLRFEFTISEMIAPPTYQEPAEPPPAKFQNFGLSWATAVDAAIASPPATSAPSSLFRCCIAVFSFPCSPRPDRRSRRSVRSRRGRAVAVEAPRFFLADQFVGDVPFDIGGRPLRGRPVPGAAGHHQFQPVAGREL